MNRFRIQQTDWDKPWDALSGDERMPLALCCLTITATAPDVKILDESTIHLDLESVSIITDVIRD